MCAEDRATDACGETAATGKSRPQWSRGHVHACERCAGGPRGASVMSDIPVHTGHLPAIAIDEKSDRHGAGRFDYGPLPQEKVGALRACCARIRTQIMKTVAPIIAIGRELIAAKKILRHGAFGDWVESECGFTMRTAQNYMKASRLSSKYESVSHLPPATLYRMCGRRTPVELVDKVVACASRGEEVTEAEFDRMQREFRKSTIRVVRPNAQDDGSADDEREGNFDSRFGKKDFRPRIVLSPRGPRIMRDGWWTIGEKRSFGSLF